MNPHRLKLCGFAGAAWISLFLVAWEDVSAQSSPPPSRLRDVVRPSLAVGGVIHGYDPIVWLYPQHMNVASLEFNAISVSCYMAYGAWPNPRLGPDTSGLNRLVDWASERGMLVHGHPLVYPKANLGLPWYMNLNDSEVEARLRRFVRIMTLTRANQVWVWDVVNEALADDGELMDADGLRPLYKEYQAMGAQYVDKAFHWAKSGDSNALLILNDYGIEQINPKSDRMLAYALKLKARNVPIDGIGFQMHWSDSLVEPDYASIRANFQRFADAGFQIFITEMDAAAANTRATDQLPSTAELKQQSRIYQSIAKIAADQPACKSFLMWDFVDNYSWLHPSKFDSPPDFNSGDYLFPTIYWGGLGEPVLRKPSYNGLRTGLKGISARLPQPTTHTITSNLTSPTGSLFRPTTRGIPRPTIVCGKPERASSPDARTWTLEPVNDLIFRIRCHLGGASSYLMRSVAPSNPPAPLDSVITFGTFDDSDERQLWIVRQVDGGFTIQNKIDPSESYLTRDANVIPAGTGPERVTALATVSLKPTSSRSDQVWTLVP